MNILTKKPEYITIIGLSIVLCSLINLSISGTGIADGPGSTKEMIFEGETEVRELYFYSEGDMIILKFEVDETTVDFFVVNEYDYWALKKGYPLKHTYNHIYDTDSEDLTIEISDEMEDDRWEDYGPYDWDYHTEYHNDEENSSIRFDEEGMEYYLVFIPKGDGHLTVNVRVRGEHFKDNLILNIAILMIGSIISFIGAVFYLLKKKQIETPPEIPYQNNVNGEMSTAGTLFLLISKSDAWLNKARFYFILAGLIAILIWYPIILGIVFWPFIMAYFHYKSVSIWDGIILGSILTLLISITLIWGYHYIQLRKEWSEWKKRIQVFKQREKDFMQVHIGQTLQGLF